MAVNASEVANLLAPNYDLGTPFTNAIAQRDRKVSQQKAENRQADQDAFAFQKHIDENYGLGTGTPYDAYRNTRIQSMQQKLVDLYKSNKNPTMMQRYSAISDDARALQEGDVVAKQLRTRIDADAANIEKEQPYLNKNAVHQALLNSAFRDDKGGILPIPSENNYSKLYSGVLSDPTVQGKYVNKDQLPTYLAGDIDKRFPLSANQRIPTDIKGIYDVPEMRGFHTFNPTTRQVEVSKVDIPVTSGNTRVNLHGLPQEIEQSMFSTPAMKIARAQKLAEMEDKSPEAFKSLTPEQKSSVASYAVAKELEHFGKGSVKTDDKEFKDLMAERKEANQLRMQQERLNLARKADRRAEATTENKLKNSLFHQSTEALKTNKDGKPADPSVLASMETVEIPDQSPGSGMRIKVYKDFGSKYLPHVPGIGGAVVGANGNYQKFYYNPKDNTGFIQEYKKDLNKKLEDGSDNPTYNQLIPVGRTPIKDFKQKWSTLENQIKGMETQDHDASMINLDIAE